MSAASLFEFKELLNSVPQESIKYHHQRGDFVRWVRSTLNDDELASHLDKLSHRASLAGHLLRQALYQRVADRYAEIHQR